MQNNNRKKLYRVTTISDSLCSFFNGQLKFLNNYYEVTGLASDTGNLKAVGEREGIQTIHVEMKREISLMSDIKSLVSLYRVFKKNKPDIVHASTPKGSLLSMVAAWLTGVPHRIYTVTGLRFETESGFFRFLLKTMERITCICANKVIPEGLGVRNTLLHERITKKVSPVIHYGNINGVDLSYFDRHEDVLAASRTINPNDAFAFCFIGRLVGNKGVNELVSAFNRISTHNKGVKLFLLGNYEETLDPLKKETKELIRDNESIVYFGFQSDVRPFLAASSVFILPSYREGFPNVVLQAGAMGVPCIVTNINGCNEAIIDGKNGLVVPKQDADALYVAMNKMISDITLTESMAKCSRELISSRYDQKDVWNAILSMYQSL